MKSFCCYLSFLLVANLAMAEDKGSYNNEAWFAGPNSTLAQLEEDDKDYLAAFRFPKIDSSLHDFKTWKHEVYEEHGLQFGVDYTHLYQSLSDKTSGAEHDAASAGIARFYGKWELFNRGQDNMGSLVFKVDHRHRSGDTTPSALGGNAGYLSQTGMLFSDKDLVLVDFYWQQKLNKNTGFILGKYDPNDFFHVLGYANPWTSFSNLDTLQNMSIALPDNSYGVGFGHWFNDSVYLISALNDANGSVDTDEPFEGSDFYKSVEMGWTPSREERYFTNVHVSLWHMDGRDSYGVDDTSSDESKGVALGANYTWDMEWMLFGKLGFSDVETGNEPQLYEQSMTLGMLKYFKKRSDLFGLSVSHGEIADEVVNAASDSQTTWETFYRLQVSENMSVTANVQCLIDPALNNEDDQVWVTGLRLRVSL